MSARRHSPFERRRASTTDRPGRRRSARRSGSRRPRAFAQQSPGPQAPDARMRADRPVRGGDGPRGRQDRLRPRRSGDRPIQAAQARSLGVGGVAPPALPAGRLSGKAIRDADGPASDRVRDRPKPLGGGRARPICPISSRRRTSSHADLAAAVDPGGLKREVFGFLPYWELTDSSTRLDWEKLSTIAYFGVGAAGERRPSRRRNSDGSTTVGWSGWTSSKMTASSTPPTPTARGSC